MKIPTLLSRLMFPALAALLACAALPAPAQAVTPPAPAQLTPALDQPSDWDVAPIPTGDDGALKDIDGMKVMAVGAQGATFTSRKPIAGPTEVTAVFRMTRTPDSVALAVGVQPGVPYYQTLSASVNVPAGPPLNYMYCYTYDPHGAMSRATVYRVWDMPAARLDWPEMVRLKVEEDVNSLPKLAEKWLTYRFILQPHHIRIYLDGRLLDERSGPTVDITGNLRLQLSAGDQLASLKITPVPLEQPSRFEPVDVGFEVNASKLAGQALAEGAIPSGEQKIIDDVPFLFPKVDRKGNNHIDIGVSWVRAGFVSPGQDPGDNDPTGAPRWMGTMLRDPSRIQFRVPNARYLNLHLIAAADGRPDSVPIVTAQFYRAGSGHPVNFATRVPLFTAHSGPGGSMSVRLADGKKGKLFHITIPLEPDSLSSLAENEIVEVELTKGVEVYRAFPDPYFYSWHGAGLPSSVQVFALTLERPRVDVDFEPDAFAHMFTEPVQPSYTVTLRNSAEKPQNVELDVATLSHDGAEKTSQKQKVTVPANGNTQARFALHLTKYGYHDVTLTIKDDQGTRTRARSLAHLHADTRERGDWQEGRGIIYGFWDWNGGHLTPSGIPRLQASLAAGCESTMHGYEGMAYADHPITPPDEREFLTRHRFMSRFLAYQFSPSKDPLGGLEWDPTKPDVMAKAVVNTLKKSPSAQATAINSPSLAVFYAEPIIGDISVISLPEYFNEPPYQMTAAEQVNYKKFLDFLLIAGGAIKKEWPNAKIAFPWGIPNFPIPFLRNSKEATALMDGPAVDMAPFEREPELQMGQVTLQNEMWQLQQEWKKHTTRPFPQLITVEGPGCAPAVPGALTQDEEAQSTVRTLLALMSYNVTQFLGGPVIFNCSGAWGEQHYGGGLCEGVPILSPHVGYCAFATLTRHINRANYVKWLPTGSNSVYCLQFKHYKTGELIHVMWTLRGTRPVTLQIPDGASVEVFDSMDNATTLAPSNGKATFTISSAPCFIHGLASDAVVAELGTPDHSDAAPAKVATRLASLGDGTWQISNDRDEYLETAHKEYVRHFPGVMTTQNVDAPEAQSTDGKALAVHLEKQPIERFVMPYYSMLTPAKPITIEGKPSHLGLWVKGSSDWGRVIYLLRDASGQPWVSVGTKDEWNNDDTHAWSQFCFDGWRYLRFELPANAPWDCFRETGTTWWGQPAGTGDGIVHLPLTLEKIAVERRTHVLYVTDLVPANPADVELGDLYAEYASPSDRSEAAVEISKLRMPEAKATVEAAGNPIAKLEAEGVGPATEITKIEPPAHDYDGRRCNVFFTPVKNAASYDIWVSRSPDGHEARHVGTLWSEPGKLVEGLSANTDLYLFVSYLDKDGKPSKPSKPYKVNLKDMFPMK